jgi:DMSO reductase anchor subunit
MRDPRVSAAISVVGIVIVGSMMLFSTETPSTAVTVLQWLLLAGCVIGLIGSLVHMGNRH